MKLYLELADLQQAVADHVTNTYGFETKPHDVNITEDLEITVNIEPTGDNTAVESTQETEKAAVNTTAPVQRKRRTQAEMQAEREGKSQAAVERQAAEQDLAERQAKNAESASEVQEDVQHFNSDLELQIESKTEVIVPKDETSIFD